MQAYRETSVAFWLFVICAIVLLFVTTGMALGELGKVVIVEQFLSMLP